MNVIIDGIKYVPETSIKPLDDGTTKEVLKVLTEMRYFNQSHKMSSLAYDAISCINKDIADLNPDIAYQLIHGEAK
jgi:hypothetical protein